MPTKAEKRRKICCKFCTAFIESSADSSAHIKCHFELNSILFRLENKRRDIRKHDGDWGDMNAHNCFLQPSPIQCSTQTRNVNIGSRLKWSRYIWRDVNHATTHSVYRSLSYLPISGISRTERGALSSSPDKGVQFEQTKRRIIHKKRVPQWFRGYGLVKKIDWFAWCKSVVSSICDVTLAH